VIDYERQRFLAGVAEKTVNDFLADQINLNALCSRLKGIIANIREYSDPEWAEELFSYWAELEYINASILAHDDVGMTENQRNNTRSIAEELIAHLTV
jgi:hypothetical protein